MTTTFSNWWTALVVATFALASGASHAQQTEEQEEQIEPSAAEQTSAPGAFRMPDSESYPAEAQIGKPGDVEDDFQTSFPKRDSLFPDLVPSRWSGWRSRYSAFSQRYLASA